MFSFLKEIDVGFKIPSPDSTIKVAVTGMSRSGKTVFLTSLINQLLANDKLPYLNEKLARPFVARILPPSSKYRRFDYFSKLKSFREKEPSWPEATKDVSKTTVQLEIKSQYAFLENQIINLEIIDYPGEWLIDLSMLDQSFSEWSDMTLNLIKDTSRKDYAQSFFTLLEEIDLYKKDLDESKDELIFDSYCEFLKSLYYNHYSFMQPGRFLEPGDLACDPILHFAPLPTPKEGVRVDKNSIYARFHKKYDLYLKEVVSRLYLEHFKYFDTQIILVDLIKTLQYGKESFDDMNLAFRHILKSFTYGSNTFLSRLFSLKIDHVIFAATKADFIPRAQHNNYMRLLEDMIRRLKNELDVANTKSEVTIFSSVKSTNYVQAEYNGEVLECIEGVVEGESEPSLHFPGALPDDYRSENFWRDYKFEFPKFRPIRFPQNDDEAVEHIRMDRLIYSLIKGRV